MAGTVLPADGSETSFAITVDGASKLLDGQLDGGTWKQVVSTMTHQALGTMDVAIAQDLQGWSGTLSAKAGNSVLSRAMDIIEASVRIGIKPVITITRTTRFKDLTSEKYLYYDCVVEYDGSTKRGEFDTANVTWRTGKGRVAQ